MLNASQATLSEVIHASNLATVEAFVTSAQASQRETRAWMQLDKFASSILTTLPHYYGRVPNLHFSEMVARFMLLPSPILVDVVGKTIYGLHKKTYTPVR